MITTRIATAAAILTFGIAGLGATVVTIAAPAHADTIEVDGTPMTDTAGAAIEHADRIPHEIQAATRGPNVTAVPAPGSAATQDHVVFPLTPAPHSEHDGQGKKGSDE